VPLAPSSYQPKEQHPREATQKLFASEGGHVERKISCSSSQCAQFAILITRGLLYVKHKTFRLKYLSAEINPICHLLALLVAQHILYVSGVRVNYESNQQDKTI
jgi:hypothetical protein